MRRPVHFLKVLPGLLLALLLTTPALAGRRWAVVNLSVANLREQPSYPAELGSQALMGTPVELLDRQGYWCKVIAPDPYTAWVNELALAPMEEDSLRAYLAAPKWLCTAMYSQVLAAPSPDADPLCDLVRGCLLRRCAAAPVAGYVKVLLPDDRAGYAPAADLLPYRKSTAAPVEEGIVREARRYAGIPYLWGGASGKGFDCSGLVRHVYLMNGVLLPRNASQQWRCGKEVPLGKLRPGDLIFWGTQAAGDQPARPSHVGIYLGDHRFIHASQRVRISSLRPEDSDYYERTPIGARRILGTVKACPFRFGDPVPVGAFFLAGHPYLCP